MRVDGRKPDELRPIVITPNYTIYAEGSALISMGNTKVLCNATIQEKVPSWIKNQGQTGGWITAEYAMLPRAAHQRSPRETFGLKGRTQEIRRLIGRSLRAAVDLSKIGERTCIIDCDVLQADGGTRTAAVTGGYIALVMALKKYIDIGQIPDNALQQQVAAISVGIVDNIPLLDLNYDEDHRAQADANIVMANSGEFIEIQTTAEKGTFSRILFDDLLTLAYKGIGELLKIQSAILDEAIYQPGTK